ncbi:MAG: GtrA family protein [Nocardioidaceae bacterium]
MQRRCAPSGFAIPLVGATTVAIDFVFYQLFALLGVALTPAKAISFIVATVCAYLFNRSFTFGAAGGRRTAASFIYVVRRHAGRERRRQRLGAGPCCQRTGAFVIVAAFLCAQVVSSTINFFGMRHFVFAANRAVDRRP